MKSVTVQEGFIACSLKREKLTRCHPRVSSRRRAVEILCGGRSCLLHRSPFRPSRSPAPALEVNDSQTRWPRNTINTHPRNCRNWGSKNPPDVAAAAAAPPAAAAAAPPAASAAPVSEDVEGLSSRRLPESKAGLLLKVFLGC